MYCNKISGGCTGFRCTKLCSTGLNDFLQNTKIKGNCTIFLVPLLFYIINYLRSFFTGVSHILTRKKTDIVDLFHLNVRSTSVCILPVYAISDARVSIETILIQNCNVSTCKFVCICKAGVKSFQINNAFSNKSGFSRILTAETLALSPMFLPFQQAPSGLLERTCTNLRQI